MLKAIADKLIPGIPEGTKISLLQQTKLTEDDAGANPDEEGEKGPTVLQEVVDNATARNEVEQEIRGMP